MKLEVGLYVVATPIGNLGDITLRAIETLKHVNVIAAEDTRHSARLMQHYQITTPMLSLHAHNEAKRAEQLLARLARGESVALISDAGTPLINDPGYVLVNHVRDAGFKVIPLPGACAAVAALSVSGLSTAEFTFVGFLPTKAAARRQALEKFANEPRTLIFYEAPHRIVKFIEACCVVMGEQRRVVIARELTKTFETIHAGYLAEVLKWLQADSNQQKGEFVVLLEGAPAVAINVEQYREPLQQMLAVMPLKQAVAVVSELTGQHKNVVYQFALTVK